MTCSEDGKYITCTACSVYDSRKASKSGVVSCARGRIFRFDSMLDHIKHEYHTTSMSRLAIDEDGAKLSTDQFRKKYGRDFAKRKKATTMSDFFHFLPKKAKNAHTENVTIDDAIIESDEAPNETLAITVDLDETPNAPNVSKMPAVRRNVCGGAFSTLDRVDEGIQSGLEVTQKYYDCTNPSGVIKIIEGTKGVYSMFHLECDGINVQ